MGNIANIIHIAMIMIGSVAALIAVGAGIYFYYTSSGQEEGE